MKKIYYNLFFYKMLQPLTKMIGNALNRITQKVLDCQENSGIMMFSTGRLLFGGRGVETTFHQDDICSQVSTDTNNLRTRYAYG